MEILSDYSEEAVAAARSALMEVCHVLGEYREDIVLVGGWVPFFIIPQSHEHHIGSTDVDLALNHIHLQEAGYQRIEKLLLGAGYSKAEEPYRFVKTINGIDVYVDLLAGEYSGTGKKHRHQKVQNLKARKARGCDLAFDNPVNIKVDGTLPDGAMDTVTIQAASITSFLVMKGMALATRFKDKDSYDVYYCVSQYPGGYERLAKEFKGLVDKPLVREGLSKIRDAFSSIDHRGPRDTANSYDVDATEKGRIRRDSFERVNAFLDLALKGL